LASQSSKSKISLASPPLTEAPLSVDDCRRYLEQSLDTLDEAFTQKISIRDIIQARARHLDHLIGRLWHQFGLSDNLALIAVGGYGRGELHPCSDIDLLILYAQPIDTDCEEKISRFITHLWDCRLQIGHAARSVDECLQIAKEDVTVLTSLMESRPLCGNQSLYSELKQRTTPDQLWDAKSFFRAKTDEQIMRYKRFDSSSYDLEPNLKSSPGGLRDIQLVSWVAQRCYYPKTLAELIHQQIITKKEYYALSKSQLYLWQVRYALHRVANKGEDRLLFDHQKNVAKLLGFKDTANSMAVEKMMKRYYRAVLVVRNLCEMLLQSLEEDLFDYLRNTQATPIDDNFQWVNQRLDAIDERCFVKDPSNLLLAFHHVAQNPKARGITAKTQRAMRAARYKINDSFRHNPKHKRLFIDFWRFRHESSLAMFLMKRSGILADMLPAFAQISGQMQYDLFHNYTVDEHTLFLLKNLTAFFEPAEDERKAPFALCRKIMRQLQRPHLIFLAGLFHDIGKGRGGDHSEIGAVEAETFCREHGLSDEDTEVISWLVRNHLLMSLTAQKRDISDPKVIEQFANQVKSQQKLDLLYVLTVADIRATSQTLWNSWKDSLLRELYLATSEQLKVEAVDEYRYLQKQAKAREQLIAAGYENLDIDQHWQYLDDIYFIRRSVDEIVWQTSQIIEQTKTEHSAVALRSTRDKSGTEVFVYTADRENLFVRLTAALSQLGLNIQAAKIFTDNHHYCYDSFILLDQRQKRITDKDLKQKILHNLRRSLDRQDDSEFIVERTAPRRLRHFLIATQVNFVDDEFTGLTRIELITRDRPGLLALVGQAFRIANIRLHDAKITTLGERVEDTFIVSHKDNSPIKSDEEKIRIAQIIEQHLNY